jgi:hypothetical protein
MLGVRREGVTEGALKLQKSGLIKYTRGHITVLDRNGLERRSCECYAVVKKKYDRLLPNIVAAWPRFPTSAAEAFCREGAAAHRRAAGADAGASPTRT